MLKTLKKILFIFIFALLGSVAFAQNDSDENRFDFDYTLTPKDVKIADIGSGGGLPGIPLALSLKDYNIRLKDI